MSTTSITPGSLTLASFPCHMLSPPSWAAPSNSEPKESLPPLLLAKYSVAVNGFSSLSSFAREAQQ